ncbi:hypothetical protein [Hydrogenimonas thermophila]|uniref:Uncharacterized protein n=1 Tax=Hydrogenimonas thermophila TaxID=223786 RepID=A0A1I5KP81_9BACT|nr:hypothetical protein [Hydrogenimonas thermophila]SFO86900.1 hypothetical protein SAMN05216234_10122 [Hydrogenimonas thermophila]
MKQIIKRILLAIVQKGYLNFIARNLKLKFYKELEIKKVPLIRDVLYTYYESILNRKHINCDEDLESQPRVFFLTNIFPLWEKSTSNFLKINADIANVYIKNGIEVNFILANHSHLSYLTNRGIKWKDFMNVDYEQIENKIKEDLYNMYKIERDKVKVHILNKNNGNIKLKDYIENVINFFNSLNLTKKDIVVFSGGKCKSDLLQIIMPKLCSKKIYLTTGAKEEVECSNYDYVLTSNSNLLNKYKNAILPINVNFSPFKWEEDENISNKEKIIIESLEKESIIFVSSKQRYADSIDNKYIDILNNIMLKHNNLYLILIGDSKERILSILENKIEFNSNRIICIEFINSLYTFFKELNNNNFKTLYILPRITGSGVSNLMAACAKIPTTIFKGNDADGNWIPSKYFVETKEEYINQIEEFIKDEKKIEEFINDFEKFRREKQKIGEKFYLELLKG